MDYRISGPSWVVWNSCHLTYAITSIICISIWAFCLFLTNPSSLSVITTIMFLLMSNVVPAPYLYENYPQASNATFSNYSSFVMEPHQFTPFIHQDQTLTCVVVITRADASTGISFGLLSSVSVSSSQDGKIWVNYAPPTTVSSTLFCDSGLTTCRNITLVQVPFLHSPYYQVEIDFLNQPNWFGPRTFSFNYRNRASQAAEMCVSSFCAFIHQFRS